MKMNQEFNRICKETMQVALRSKYGFKPALKEIILLEANDDRTHILAQVGDREYKFSSYVCDSKTGSVWVDDCTIEQTAKIKWSPQDGYTRIAI
jgi:hypothetical protein